jgi:hypothetical protein
MIGSDHRGVITFGIRKWSGVSPAGTLGFPMMPKTAFKQGIFKKMGFPPTPGTGIRSWQGKGLWQTLLSGRCAASGKRNSTIMLLMAAALFLPLFLPPALPAQESSKTYQTQYAAISYAAEKDLHLFTRNTGSGLSFLRESPERNPLLAKTQVDKIVETVCSLLDMHPLNFRFNITLYRTQAEVTTAFYRASAGANAYKAQSMTGAAPIAFYSHGARNIAVAIDNITDGILAHEIAHAILSAYFATPPPGPMQEILAQYMDKHFRDK